MNPYSEPLIVAEEESGMRLDLFLKSRLPDFSRTYFQELISQQLVLVNQEAVKKRTLVSPGDEIEVAFTLTQEISLEAEAIDLNIIYEDESLIAINKPAALVVHPGCNNGSHTLVNGLLYYIKELPHTESLRPGIVHRLDKDTTGVILCAKTREMQEKLVALFAERKIEKQYLAVTLGKPKVTTIHTLIGRHPTKRQQMAVVEKGGKEAMTEIEILNSTPELSLLLLRPKTGRTHQLRVHLQSIHCPIIGDPVYGSIKANQRYHIPTQLLHAYKLTFIHPLTGKKMELEAPLPEMMHDFLLKHGIIVD